MNNTIQHFRTSIVLHLYNDHDIGRLNVLLGQQNSWKVLSPVGKQNSYSEAVWLVHVPFANESHLGDIFITTPLRLDSQVYAFFQVGNPGKLKQ